MNTIHIPASIEEAVDQLGAIERLLVARGWERAAIIAAFVHLPGRGTRRDEEATSRFLTPQQFADLGIAGLRTHDTVRLYAQRWLDAHDGIHPEPGAEVELPDLDWPPTRTGTNGHNSDEGMERTIRDMTEQHGAGAVATALTEAAAETGGTEAVAEAVANLPAQPRPRPEPTPIEEDFDRMGAAFDAHAILSTARGHLVSAKLLNDQHPDTFTAEHALKMRRLSDAWSMLADVVTGLSNDDLTALLQEVE